MDEDEEENEDEDCCIEFFSGELDLEGLGFDFFAKAEGGGREPPSSSSSSVSASSSSPSSLIDLFGDW